MVPECCESRFRHATIGLWVIVQTVVLPSGEVIQTRRRARKSSAGFDTTKLFIGAEGTLGIVTEGALVRSIGGPSHQQLSKRLSVWHLSCRTKSQWPSSPTSGEPSTLSRKS